MKAPILTLLLLPFTTFCFSQQKFQVLKKKNDFYIANSSGKIIRKLNKNYLFLLSKAKRVGFFAVFAIKDQSGYIAIDINEKKIFEVYSIDTGTPDNIIENRIRILKNGKMGFANEKGQIVIKPRFDIATSFRNDKAIIGQDCKEVPLFKDHKGDDPHNETVCKRHGYIDKNGNIKMLGNYTFEQIQKKINWKAPDNQYL